MPQTTCVYLNNGQIVTSSVPLPLFQPGSAKRAALAFLNAYSFSLGLVGLFSGTGGLSPAGGYALAGAGTAIAGAQLALESNANNFLGAVGSGSGFAPGMTPAVFGATFGTALGGSSSQDSPQNPNGPGRD